jgi:Ran GTPase-activating protein (RanGAP) involved in mRNA processing and transport
VVEARPGQFPNGLGLLAKLNGFSPSWTMTELRLGGCNLRAAGGAALATFLHGNTTLTELDVSRNYLQEAGGLALALALQGNTTLTKLDLSRNVMGDTAGTEFAKLLRTDTTLRCLNLSFNRLERAVVVFGWKVTRNATLTSLALGGNEMRNTGGAVALAAALRRNTTLEDLDLDSGLMGRPEIVALTAALGQNTTLAKLHLRCMLPLAQLALVNALHFDPGLVARISTAPRPA